MTETQISCFLQVAETNSFSKAAVHLYVSQSAVSKHISALEEEIGTELFIRGKNSVQLTTAGNVIKKLLLHQKQERLAVLNDLKHLNTLAAEKIRLGCRPTWNPRNFSLEITSLFTERFPETSLEIIGFEPCGPIPMLLDGKLDLAIVYDVEPTYYNDVSFLPFTKLDIGFIFPKDDPLYQGKSSPEDFLEFPFLTVDTPAGRILSRFYEKELQQLHFHAKLKKMPTLQEAVFQSSLGNGVVLVDEWETSATSSVFQYVSLNRKLPVQLVYLTNGAASAKNIVIAEIVNCCHLPE